LAAELSSMTERFCRSAWDSRDPSRAWRDAQLRAAAQPSSTTNSKGPLPVKLAEGFSSGWASPRITQAAAARRRANSHHGVRAGVSSGGISPSSKRIAGKDRRRGAGGVTRSSHHSTGSTTRAKRRKGCAKARGPSCSMTG
jgi:hypothetical protein